MDNYFYDLPRELQEYIQNIIIAEYRNKLIKNIYNPWEYSCTFIGKKCIQEKRSLQAKNKTYTYFSYYYDTNEDYYKGKSFLLYYTKNFATTSIISQDHSDSKQNFNEFCFEPK